MQNEAWRESVRADNRLSMQGVAYPPGAVELCEELCAPHHRGHHEAKARVGAADGKDPSNGREAGETVQAARVVAVVAEHGRPGLRPHAAVLQAMADLRGGRGVGAVSTRCCGVALGA
eukprot:230527-Chlamydomonas_euryale.AAC.1